MKNSVLFIVCLLLIGANVFANDVEIDQNGNITTGISSSANLEVTGASAEEAIIGISSGSGGTAVHGENSTYGNYGRLGGYTFDDLFPVGVYGYYPSGYAGFFHGAVGVTGDLIVQGTISGYTETDPTVAASVKDGVDWTELTGIPDDFSDGVDDAGFWSQSGSDIYYNSGNVGIGTDTPNEQLEITGNLRLPGTTATTGIIMSNAARFIHEYGVANFFAGLNSGNLSMIDAAYNTGVGTEALDSLTTGDSNTGVGSYVLGKNDEGSYNTAVGRSSLAANLTGSFNTGIGYAALYKNTGNLNTAVGSRALEHTTGDFNTGVGGSALYFNTTGTYNTAVGSNAGVTSSGFNLTNTTAIGYSASVDASNKVVIGNTSVTSIGGYASWSNYSDQRVKIDVQKIENGLDLIKQLKPVSFKMKNGNGNTDFGFVAQDIEELLGEKYNVLDIGGGDKRMLSLRYTQFIAPMVKAMQQQQEMLEQQQSQIAELKKIVEELKKNL